VRNPRWHGALLIAALAASAGASTCALAPEAAPDRARELAIHGLGVELFLGLLALAGAALSAQPARERLGLAASRLGPAQLGLLALGTLALSHALDAVIEVCGLGGRGALAELASSLAGIRGATLALALLGIGLAPGISEELLCRGLVQRGLVPRFGPRAAVTVAAACFGALHVDPVHAGFAAVLGLYLGTLSHVAGSVRPAIACHAANNLCAVLAAAWLPEPGIPPAASIALGGGFALAALAWVWRRAGATPPDAEAPPPGAEAPSALHESRATGTDAPAQLGPTDGGRIGRL
jgi:membrane protease YdiL (CAAX protease family)